MKLAKLLVSIGVISALAGCGEPQTATTHIAKAKSFQFSDVDAKLIELKNAIKLEPRNAEARYLLGEAYLAQGFALGAMKELEKGYEYNYDKNKIIPLLARSYILTSSDQEVVDLSDDANGLDNDVFVRYLAYKTFALIRLSNLEDANGAAEQARSILSDSAHTLLARAYLEMAEGDLDKAKNTTSKVLTIEPTQLDALLLLGQINSALNNYSEATINYTEYAKLQPKSNIIIMFLAQSLLKEKKYVEANKYADSILASSPNQPFAHYVKAMSQFSVKNYSDAKKHAEEALKANFNQAQLKLVAGISSYFLANYEQSHHHLEAIVPYLTPDHPARKMYALSQLQLGMIDDISGALEGFDAKTEEDNKFLSSLSYRMAELGAIDNAKLVAEKVAGDGANNAEQNMRDGVLKLMLNDPSGMDDLKNAVELNPNMAGAELALAYAAIQKGDYKQAKDIAQRWKTEYPEKLGGFNVLAAVYLKQGEIDAAKAEMRDSLKVSPKNLFALLELTNLAMIEGDKAEAENLSEFALEEFPLNPKVLMQYYSIRKNQDAFDDIADVYNDNKEQLEVAMVYAELLINTGNHASAANVLDNFSNTVRSPTKLWLLKVAAQKGAENNNKALVLLKEWIEVNPYHIEPVIMLSDYFGRMKDTKQALNIVEAALNGPHANNIMLKMAKMQLLLDTANVYSAKIYFQELKDQKIVGILSQGIEGKIALLDKDYAKASKLLAKFYKDSPISKNALILNRALQGNNQNLAAIELLEYHLEKNEKDNQVRLALANNYLSVSPDKAIISYKRILQDYPESVMVLNNLAWLTMEQKELDNALSYSEAAYKLDPDNINVIDTKAMILFKLGRVGEALRHLGVAHTQSKGKNVDVALNYAEVLIASNRKLSANKVLDDIRTNNVQELNRIADLRVLAK